PNPDYSQKIGMTANLKIQIDTREDALRIPNATLRFRPTNEMFAALQQEVPPEAGGGRGRGGAVQGRPQNAGSQGSQGATAAAGRPRSDSQPRGVSGCSGAA